ncbi:MULTISPECIES: sensor histidine kinase [Ralstonia]|jgi:two-component system, OmpR family, sensor kinase|uniref:histidine kinase n=1 Tax=Ralstonia pickettii TaxID=329 RepID=A0ABN9HXZ8_RALPI|nr:MULTISPECIES: ATP-binding protein [Ralstonia]MBA4015254.1 histidine kinase [Ralstonia sp.]MBA4200057.1 histidine kinase [Ralstonia sp.]MBA4229113.1 histidine kinase [Ralstonia sp.]MBA4234299.1 histidine kinase [Ralstonia sp.]MBA4278351.1 histidine kinase [Ralstonia sp.]
MQSPNRAPAAPDGRRFGIESPSILRPIRVRLTLVFVIFLLLVVGVGAFSIDQLASFHSVSAQISGRWLQNSRILGDLNNYISDYRAAEGDFLIASSRADLRAADEQVAMLDKAIATSQARYDKIEHDSPERELYSQFVTQWNTYRELARRLMISAKAGDVAGATRLYHTDSKHAFDSANDTLGVMTERSVAGATAETEREAQAYHDARQLIVGAIVVAACLVVLAVIYLVYAVSRPIAALVDRMHRVANNDTQIDIPGVDRHDEIGDIAQAVARFRENTIELGRSKDALIAQAAVLQETLDKERRMAELQRNFVSMASHEFRTPLGVIDGQAQRLIRMRDALPPEVLEERCEKIRAAVQRMTHLMDHLLDSSHWLDSMTPAAMRRTDFPLAALLHEVCEMHLEGTPSARIEVCVETDEPNSFFGDARLLFQAFSNLVGNAVKYSPPGAPVSVRMRSDADGVSVTVEDRGLGIPERDIERLFERYVRGGNVAGTVGAGVGLYLVKLVVELHRGTITVTSEEGKGSTFNVFLPRLKG